jgi:hypothetical protein
MSDNKPMQSDSRGRQRWIGFEWIAAIVLGLLAALCFYLQISSPPATTTQRELALINALQFLLTTGFTWFSTRAVSRFEFEQSLKRFAISAYRRVADIERMIHRLKIEIREMMTERAVEECTELRIVDAIVSDTNQIVRSSISDWADVIGEELLAIEKIRRLEQERETLKGDSEPRQAARAGQPTLREIESQIKTLVASLPPRLQLEARGVTDPTRQEQHAARWVKRTHEHDNGLRLTVVTGKQYDSERDQNSLSPNEKLTGTKGKDGGIDVLDIQGKTLGRLQNPSPLGYSEFVRAFELCFGPLPIALEFVESLGREKRDDDEYGWFRVKVLAKPILEDAQDRKRVSEKTA